MNTDDGWVADYKSTLNLKLLEDVRSLLNDVGKKETDNFINTIKAPLLAYLAHKRIHETIPTAKDQNRFLSKLETASNKSKIHLFNLLELLEEAPLALKSKMREIKSPIELVTAHIINMAIVLNDIETDKSKIHNETAHIVNAIREAYISELKVTPVVKAFREEHNIPQNSPLNESYVPMVGILLNISIDYAYKLCK